MTLAATNGVVIDGSTACSAVSVVSDAKSCDVTKAASPRYMGPHMANAPL